MKIICPFKSNLLKGWRDRITFSCSYGDCIFVGFVILCIHFSHDYGKLTSHRNVAIPPLISLKTLLIVFRRAVAIFVGMLFSESGVGREMFPCNDTLKIGVMHRDLESAGCPNASWTFQKESIPFCLTKTLIPTIVSLLSSPCNQNITIFPVNISLIYENLQSGIYDSIATPLAVPGFNVTYYNLLISAPVLRHKPIIFIGPNALRSASGKGCSKYCVFMALFFFI